MKHFYNYKKHLSLIVLLLILKVAGAQNVGITDKTAVTVPDASAGLDIDFSNKGLLIPRVQLTGTNTAGPLSLPAHSLLVYNLLPGGTSPNGVVTGYYYNSGTKITPVWVRLSTGVSGWSTTGNTGTTAGTNFLGTIDAQDLVIKTSDIERARFEKTTGDFNLGLATGGVAKATQSLALKSIGGFYGTSTITIQNENGVNGAILETSGLGIESGNPPAPNLADLVFKTRTGAQSNLRLEARTTATEHFMLGNTNSEWQIGSPANPTLVLSAVSTNSAGTVPTGGNSALRFGNFGIGTATATPYASDPTASLHIIRAGTATGGTAPLKINPGINLTIPESGAVENNGTHIYWTSSASPPVRYQLDQQSTLATANTRQATISGTGTVSVTGNVYKMGGFGIYITPSRSKTVMIVISGDITTSGSGDGSGGNFQVIYGPAATASTGAPASGDPIPLPVNTASFAMGTPIKFVGKSVTVPFSVSQIVTLPSSSPYWFDLAVRDLSGSTTTATDLNVSLIEF